MPAEIVTGDAKIAGHVARIAPSAQNGAVAVDVALSGRLPADARPDANLSGSIILQRIPDALSVARPAGANDNATVTLFKVTRGAGRAVAVRVRLGVGSAQRVQVLSGVTAGDTVVVSDMSAYANQSELQLR